MRDEALKNQVKTDPHSPGMYRAYVPLLNLDTFYSAFDIKQVLAIVFIFRSFINSIDFCSYVSCCPTLITIPFLNSITNTSGSIPKSCGLKPK